MSPWTVYVVFGGSQGFPLLFDLVSRCLLESLLFWYTEQKIDSPQTCGFMPGLTNTFGVGSRPKSFASWYAASAAFLRSSRSCCSFPRSASACPAFRLPSTPPNTDANAFRKRPNAPSLTGAAVCVALAFLLPVADGALVLDEFDEPRNKPGRPEELVLLLETFLAVAGGALFSSLNPSINSSMARSFHSSSGGGLMLLVVFVCSLKRDVRGRADGVSVSSLMASDGRDIYTPIRSI